MDDKEITQFANEVKVIKTALKHRSIFVVGFPSSGKTTLSLKIKEDDGKSESPKNYLVIQTDELVRDSGTLPLIPILATLHKEIYQERSAVIVEGHQVMNLLFFIEHNKWYELLPELIIFCKRKNFKDDRHKDLNAIINQRWASYKARAERITFFVDYVWE